MQNLILNCKINGRNKTLFSVNGTSVESGVECYFIRLTNGYGIKVFRYKHLALASIKRQRKASRKLIGPNVIGGLFFVDSIKDNGVHWNINRQCKFRKGWAYLTQIANTKFNKYGSHKFLGIRMDRLGKALTKIGLYSQDIHENNIGFIDKRLVLIDFGNFSCQNYK